MKATQFVYEHINMFTTQTQWTHTQEKHQVNMQQRYVHIFYPFKKIHPLLMLVTYMVNFHIHKNVRVTCTQTCISHFKNNIIQHCTRRVSRPKKERFPITVPLVFWTKDFSQNIIYQTPRHVLKDTTNIRNVGF